MEFFTLEFWEGVWDDFTEYLDELPIKILKGVLDAVAGVLEGIVPPEFLNNYQLGDVLAPTMPYIGFFLAQAGVSQGLSLIAAAVLFRVMRKVLTFGWW